MKTLFLFSLVAAVGLQQGANKPAVAPPSPALALITIPAGAYSYAQLADLLSNADRHVGVARALKSHAAVVRLKNRTFESASAVLAKALDVQFREVDRAGKSILIEPNARVLARERPWLQNLAHSFVVKNAAELTESDAQGTESMSVAINRALALAQKLKKLEETDPKGESDAYAKIEERASTFGALATPSGWIRRLTRRGLNDQQALAAILDEQDFTPIDLNPHLEVAVLQRMAEFIRHQAQLEYTKLKAAGEDPDQSIISDAEKEARGLLNVAPVGFRRLRFELETLCLFVETIVTSNGLPSLESKSPILSYDDEGKEADSFGPDYKKWVSEMRSATDLAVKLPLFLEKVKLQRIANYSSFSFSHFVESWAAQFDHEVAMELDPKRDELNLSGRSRNDGIVTTATANQVLKTENEWFAAVNDNIITFKHAYACLDRHRTWPLPALLKFEQKRLPSPPGSSSYNQFTMDDYLSYHKSISDLENARTGSLFVLRGFSMGALSESRPFAIALAQMSIGARNQLMNDLVSKEKATFSLANLEPATIIKMAAAIREKALFEGNSGDVENALSDHLADDISRMTLQLELRIKDVDPPGVTRFRSWFEGPVKGTEEGDAILTVNFWFIQLPGAKRR